MKQLAHKPKFYAGNKSFEIGDFVLTRYGEKGKIVSEWWDTGVFRGYWVDLTFMFEKRERTSREPHEEKTLKKLQKKD